jgi:hypothetical protein
MTRFARRMIASGMLICGGILIGSLVGPPSLAAQQPDVLGALLTEVRGLRAAMEQMASAGPRIQLALGRLQLQEQRVDSRVRRLEEVRAELRRAGEEIRGHKLRYAQVEEMIRQSSDPNQQREFEHELKALKDAAGLSNARVQQLTADEAVAAQDVAAEQDRWTEINQRLEELERALGRKGQER